MPRYKKDNLWFTVDVEGDELVIRDAGGERTERFDSEDDAEAAYDDYVFDALQAKSNMTFPSSGSSSAKKARESPAP